MALSYQSIKSDGNLRRFDITIDYFTREEISVYIAGDLVAPSPTAQWQWVGASDRSLRFDPAITAEHVVTVKRHTNLSAPRHSFEGGAQFVSSALDDNFQQAMRVVQEAKEQTTYSSSAESVYSVQGRVGDITLNATDIANALGYVPAAGNLAVPTPRNTVVYAYQRSAERPVSMPGSVVFDFMQGKIVSPSTTQLGNNWFSVIQDGVEPLWVTMATASNTSDTDTIYGNEWAGAVLLSQNGTKGLNSASVFIYKRTAANSAPALPTGDCTYQFQPASLTGLTNGWTATVPAASGGKYLWVSTASAVSTYPTDIIPASEWAGVNQLAADGTDGLPGLNGQNGNPGQNGTRGTVRIVVGGYSSWDGNAATQAIINAGYGYPIERDEVTLYGGSFSEVRFFTSGAWSGAVAAYIHGSMIVNGTISAEAVTAGTFTGPKYQTSSGTNRIAIGAFVDGSGTEQIRCYKNGTIYATMGGADGALYGNTSIGTPVVSGYNNSTPVNENAAGSYGSGNGGPGVRGDSVNSPGVLGISQTAEGGRFRTAGTSTSHVSLSASSTGSAYAGKFESQGVSYGVLAMGKDANGGALLCYGRIVQDSGGAWGSLNNYLSSIIPNGTGRTLGASGNLWGSVWSSNGVIQTSDERQKVHEPLTLGLDFINSVDTIQYRYKYEDGTVGKRLRNGVRAQQMQSLLGRDNRALWVLADVDDPDSTQAVVYSEFIAPLIKAVQELSAKVAELEAKLK